MKTGAASGLQWVSGHWISLARKQEGGKSKCVLTASMADGMRWIAEASAACTTISLGNKGSKSLWLLFVDSTTLFIRACVSSALVTPIHKKGPASDPANYRPIAVGGPLYRLYTIILNDRLVAWSEDMACAARFRLASAHANRPFITSSPCAISSTGPCCSSGHCSCHVWIFKRPMTPCSTACSGLGWRPLAWAQGCWLPLSPCMPVAPSP